MFVIESYPLAVILVIVTMLCWGSWANTQKLATGEWPFSLFYWDYVFGVCLFSLAFGLTLGSSGEAGRAFTADLAQADGVMIRSALIGGVIFNLANLLLVAAIDRAGMAVAFPVGIGLALVIGVIDNYLKRPVGDSAVLIFGVALVVVAIVLNSLAYRRVSGQREGGLALGLGLAVACGITMGFFYGFVAKTLPEDFANPAPGTLSPYSAVFVFSLGVVASNFLWNSWFMFRPLSGRPVGYGDYFRLGTTKLHLIGLLGGAIWCLGMSLNILASGKAGPAISYGLGQGATMVAAAWGVFVWKEFAGAPKGTGGLIAAMFACFLTGLGLIVFARL